MTHLRIKINLHCPNYVANYKQSLMELKVIIMFVSLLLPQTRMSVWMGATYASLRTCVETMTALTPVDVRPATLWMKMDTVATVRVALNELVDHNTCTSIPARSLIIIFGLTANEVHNAKNKFVCLAVR